MFDQLDKYRKNGHFFFEPTDSLSEVCDAPDDRDGVYLIYELKEGRVTLVYIGASGEKIRDYTIRDGLVGLQTAIFNGADSEKTPRSEAWPVKMLSENIEAPDIYWWVTYNGNNYSGDHPEDVKRSIFRTHKKIYGELPRWNKRWQ